MAISSPVCGICLQTFISSITNWTTIRKQNVLTLILQLNINHRLQDINAMASSSPVCGICDSRRIYNPSQVWCSECGEGLCINCIEHHSLSKGTKHHNSITMSEYQKLPSFVLDISQFCQEHNERYQFYCRRDECPCCDICIVEKHNDCTDVAILKDIAKNVKASVQFNEVEQLIDELKKTVDKIRTNRETNLDDVSEQK